MIQQDQQINDGKEKSSDGKFNEFLHFEIIGVFRFFI